MSDCLIAFGSNEGNRLDAFRAAIDRLNLTAGLRVVAASTPLETVAVGGPETQSPYLNCAIRVESTLSIRQLHRRLIEIENELGRIRRTRWGSRTIDLDLLLFGRVQIKTADLTVPHPRMSFRRFVLEPACEIAGDMLHPPSGKTLGQLVASLNNTPKLILCVCEYPFEESLMAVGDEIKTGTDSNWDLELAKNQDDFRKYEKQAKLVTYFDLQPNNLRSNDAVEVSFQQLRSAAISFSGPTLELPRDSARARLELLAAIEAMTPLTQSDDSNEMG